MSGTTTRGMLREMVRRRLADTSAEPLWDDAFLNDAIAEAVRRYSDRFPREVATLANVSAGARMVSVPGGVSPLRIVRVFDDMGEVWRQWEGSLSSLPPVSYSPSSGERLWRVWGGDLMLASPVPRTTVWRLEHLADRLVPEDDVTPMDFEIGDEDIHIALTMNVALVRRAIADGKRTTGRGAHPLVGAARMAQVDADKLFWLRRRRAKGATLSLQETGS